ncbi:MAG: LysR family transcriptional regulator [Sandaracinaceae bacterium]
MLWDDLRYVLAVARGGTLSRAASQLGVNHSTVSRRLGALAEQLGVRLFDRGSAGYVPTPAGRDLIEVAERVEEDILALEGRILGRDAELRGVVRFTSIDAFIWILADDLSRFRRRFPQVELEVSADFAPRDLSRREADVALRASNGPPEHLVGRRVGRLEFAVYGAACLAEGGADLATLPWVCWDDAADAALEQAWIRRHVPHAPIAARVDSTVSLVSAVRAGLGVGFLACALGDADPKLRRLRPIEEGFGMDLWLLTDRQLRGTARIRAFLDHLAEALAHKAPAFAGQGAALDLPALMPA